MDRRQKKTREAIFRAFSSLLEYKRYENITVQDIIDKADVGRSTFYAHFETKDNLLKAMCSDIFDHIFAGNMCEYPSPASDLESKLAHILWHLRDHKSDVLGLLSWERGDVFEKYLKDYLYVLFEMYLSDFNIDAPSDFVLNHLVGGFTETIKWWVKRGMDCTAEQTARYFMNAVETH